MIKNMTRTELNKLFTATSTNPTAFIAWAEALGYHVDPATVSRHRAGSQGITVPWAIAYTWFFKKH